MLYLGHVVSAECILLNPEKVRAIRDFPFPTKEKSLREFLGLASYYRRFVPKFAKIAALLYALMKSNTEFNWTPDAQQAFTQLKELLASPPVLSYPLFDRPFVLHTDARGQGLRANS